MALLLCSGPIRCSVRPSRAALPARHAPPAPGSRRTPVWPAASTGATASQGCSLGDRHQGHVAPARDPRLARRGRSGPPHRRRRRVADAGSDGHFGGLLDPWRGRLRSYGVASDARKALPRLLFFTDPARTPDPEAHRPDPAARARPSSSALSAPPTPRRTACAWARSPDARGLKLLIGADDRPGGAARRGRRPPARAPGAPGAAAEGAPTPRGSSPGGPFGLAARRGLAAGADAVVVSAVFASSSASAGTAHGAHPPGAAGPRRAAGRSMRWAGSTKNGPPSGTRAWSVWRRWTALELELLSNWTRGWPSSGRAACARRLQLLVAEGDGAADPQDGVMR